jgi:hypothetical protein
LPAAAASLSFAFQSASLAMTITLPPIVLSLRGRKGRGGREDERFADVDDARRRRALAGAC